MHRWMPLCRLRSAPPCPNGRRHSSFCGFLAAVSSVKASWSHPSPVPDAPASCVAVGSLNGRFCGFGTLLALHLGFLLELPGIAALGNIPDISCRFFALAQRLHTNVFILVLVNLPVHRRPGGMGGVHFPLLRLAQPAQLVRGQFRLAKPQMLCLFRSFICIGFQLFLLGTDCSTLAFFGENGSFLRTAPL